MNTVTYTYTDGQIVRLFNGRPESVICEVTNAEMATSLLRILRSHDALISLAERVATGFEGTELGDIAKAALKLAKGE